MIASASVLVDATAIPRNRGGVGRYLEYLLPALDETGQRMTIVAQRHDAAWIAAAAPSARVVIPRAKIASRARRLLWEQFALPRLARREGADLVFSPHYTMPVFTSIPVVVTFHDATFFSHPELHGRGKRLFFRTWIRYSKRHAAALIVPSQATKTEITRWTRAGGAAITVAYHGVDSTSFHEPSATELDDARLLVGSPDWIAFLGTIEPRKNVSALVDAFGTVAADPDIVTRHPHLRLALAGGTGWDSSVDQAIANSSVRDRILRLGFVADDALAGLLGGSLAVAYPSLGEGFGLPVLEAMATGTAVLTTPFLALPEVGGDVALYTQPDSASISEGLIALLRDDDDRADRRRRGTARAAEFSWASSARTHAAVFAESVGR